MEISLDGSSWRIRHDPLSQGLAERWWEAAQAAGEEKGGVGQAAGRWVPLEVPGAWQKVLGESARGVAWYRRGVPAEAREWAREGWRVRLRFEAAATDARVWVNGIEVGRHIGDYLPFEFDITEALQKTERGAQSQDEIVVRVDQHHAPRPAAGVVVEHGHLTKGFHDVLSLQHAGLWGSVTLRRTGPLAIAPMGVRVFCQSEREVAFRVLTQGKGTATLRASVIHASGTPLGSCQLEEESPGVYAGRVKTSEAIPEWNLESPRLSLAAVTIHAGQVEQERHLMRFGRRTLATAEVDGVQTVLLNGRPLEIRGMLYWGHEPEHIAPAPTVEQIQAEFSMLRKMGFNCICLCMYYPPDYFYDLADEAGLLIWQEHPVWKSRMSPDFMPEYHRLYEGFLQRDARHPSVAIISATCEHEAYDAELATWWWNQAKAQTHGALLQIQTGFLEQTPRELTDLYDDHVYDNSGRWVRFLADMHERIGELGAKPFVMGETIISNGWPDIGAMKAARTEPRAWWESRGIDACEELEQSVTRREGPQALERFRKHAAAFGIGFRKFQAEVFRSMGGNAGFVTNSIRDVPICRLGFMDDLGVWRFTPEEVRPWMGEVIGLLRTPDHLRAFVGGGGGGGGGGAIQVEYGVRGPVEAQRMELWVEGREVAAATLSATAAKPAWASASVMMPSVKAPTLVKLELRTRGTVLNSWELVALPPRMLLPEGVVCYQPAERGEARGGEGVDEIEFEERAYSSGWGLACRSWKPVRMRGPELLPGQRVEREAGALSSSRVKLVVVERLSEAVHAYLKRGGRVLLLAQPGETGLGSKWINLWGQVPWISEEVRGARGATGAIRPGEGDAVLAMLHHDLTKSTTRAVPVQQRGLVDHVKPVIRYVYTHDNGAPMLWDAVFMARVESGLLGVTCLDHTTRAGEFLLDRLMEAVLGAEIDGFHQELDVTGMVR